MFPESAATPSLIARVEQLLYGPSRRDMFEPDPDLPDPSEFIKVCPVCGAGPLKFARRLYRLDVCLCDTCGASLNVPHSAWRVRRPEFQQKA